tara:strand:- start:444 stop:599 length:156 start_codon:yes stop_codon:yes gene_type:complete
VPLSVFHKQELEALELDLLEQELELLEQHNHKVARLADSWVDFYRELLAKV